MTPDIFSVMALESLTQAIPGWVKWSQHVKHLNMFSDDDILDPFTPKSPKFLGNVTQRYRPRNGMPTVTFQEYFDLLYDTNRERFVPEMMNQDMLLNAAVQDQYSPNYRLAEIPDLNGLIAASQSKHKPVFELQDFDLTTTGAAAVGQLEKVTDFDNIFRAFAELVERLIAGDISAGSAK